MPDGLPEIPAGYERVLVEHAWYDGPKSGVAEVDGRAHYFSCASFEDDEPYETYETWPISDEVSALELHRLITART